MVVFWNLILQNIYSPAFYRDLVRRSLASSFFYFLRLAVAVCLILSITWSAFLIPGFYRLIGAVADTITVSYPDDLVIRFADGLVSANKSIPVLLPAGDSIRSFFRDAVGADAVPDYFLVVDPSITDSDTLSPRDFFDRRTLFLLTNDAFVSGAAAAIAAQPLAGFESFTIDRESALSFAGQLRSLSKFLSPLFLFGLFVLFFFFLLAYLAWLLPLVFCFWGISKIFNRTRMAFVLWYRLFVHASTLGLLFIIPAAIILPQFFISYLIFGLPISALLVVRRNVWKVSLP